MKRIGGSPDFLRSWTPSRPQPTFTSEPPYLALTIYRDAESAEQAFGGELLRSLNRSERSGWNWLVTVGNASSSEYAAEQELSLRTAVNHLNRFVDLGLATKVGAGPSTRYELKKP